MNRRGNYTEHEVTQAILLLQISASAEEFLAGFENIGELLGWNHGAFWNKNPAYTLAYEAWNEAYAQGRENSFADDEDWAACIDAEAATLLEEGWRP